MLHAHVCKQKKMKFTCPVCRTVYHIDDKRFIKPVARSICRTCGSELSLNQKTGVVAATKKTENTTVAGSTNDSGTEPKAYTTPFSEPTPPAPSGNRDYLALGILAAVIAAFIVAGFYLTGGMGRFFSSKPTKMDPALRAAAAKQNPPARSRATVQTTAGKRQPKRSAEHIRRGYQLYKKGRFNKALQAFSKAVQLNPENAAAYFWRGRTYIKNKQYTAAASDFSTALKLNPGYSEAYDNLGWLAMRRGALDESLRYLNRSIRLKQDNGWAYYNRGHIYFKRGKQKLALKDAQKACSLGYKAACQVYARYKNRG